jgi:hypothetical protein
VFGFLLAIAPVLQAQLVANCEEPTGSRYDMIASLVKSQQDRFGGAHPVLVVSANPDSTILSYSWGPAKWAADAGMPTTVERAIIVSRMGEKITAVNVMNDPAVGDGVPNAGTFYARCTVEMR